MEDRPHSAVPSRLKHLIARVSAVVKGDERLGAVEGWHAHDAAGGGARARPGASR
jgi:hypothetical protein